MSDHVTRISRRDFLRFTGVAGGGLLLGVSSANWPSWSPEYAAAATSFAPNVFLQIETGGEVTVWVTKTEMGQGVRTALPMIIADELGVEWGQVRIRQADAAADDRYGSQLTGGSTSTRTLWDPLRRAGATARELLIGAAAGRWEVDLASCVARAGQVHHEASDRNAGYGELVDDAAELELPDPETLILKSSLEYKIIGTDVRRVDGPAIVTGAATFGLDTRVPGMIYAAVARCPVYGGRLGEYDPGPALAVPGVQRVVSLEGRHEGFYIAAGVAVIAENSWAAIRGARALEVDWSPGTSAGGNTEQLRAELRQRVQEPGTVVRNDGDAEAALNTAAQRIEATYELPYLAHSPMEPMNCIAQVKNGNCEVWSPTQNPQSVQRGVGMALEIEPEAVSVHVTLVGGGFGRRLYPDVEMEAAMIARQLSTPVQVVWTREDDIRHDRYRPMSQHLLRGGIDAAGKPVSWFWRIANTHTDRFIEEDFPAYAIPNYHVEYTHAPWILPRGAWRGTTLSQNPFIIQSFLDEMAVAGKRDPLDLRIEVLRNSQRPADSGWQLDPDRMIAVLELAAEKAGWGRTLPEGRGQGIAFQYGYESYVAEIVEVSVHDDETRVERVVGAIDCGQAVNPDMVRTQIESGVLFGLSAAVHQQISVEGGRVQQSNFHDYPLMRMDEIPAIEAHIVPSEESPGGVGEAPLPALAPALANAVYAASGRRVRKLPISG